MEVELVEKIKFFFTAKFFCQYLKSKYINLMAEDDISDFDTWVQNNEGAQNALCDVQVIEQFASWLCHNARKSEKMYNGEPVSLRTIQDMISSTKSIFNKYSIKNFRITKFLVEM